MSAPSKDCAGLKFSATEATEVHREMIKMNIACGDAFLLWIPAVYRVIVVSPFQGLVLLQPCPQDLRPGLTYFAPLGL